jgi:hypothetical protein
MAGFNGAVRILHRRASTVINPNVMLPMFDDIFRYPNIEPTTLPESLVILPIVS